MNDRAEIVRETAELALAWLGLFVVWAFVVSTPSEATRSLSEVTTERPELLVGWLLFNAFVLLGIVFRSYRGGSGSTPPRP